MNKKELDDWIKSAKRVDITEYDYNDDNRYQTNIYEKDGKLYKIGFCNGYPSAKWNDKCGFESERDAEGKRILDKNNQCIYIYEPEPVIGVPQIIISKDLVYINATETPPNLIEIRDYHSRLVSEDADLIRDEIEKYIKKDLTPA